MTAYMGLNIQQKGYLVYQTDGTVHYPIPDDEVDGNDFDPDTIPYDDSSDVEDMSNNSSPSGEGGDGDVDVEKDIPPISNTDWRQVSQGFDDMRSAWGCQANPE